MSGRYKPERLRNTNDPNRWPFPTPKPGTTPAPGAGGLAVCCITATPTPANPNAVVVDAEMGKGTRHLSIEKLGQPDYPRTLTMQGSAKDVAGVCVAEGTNAEGQPISEEITLDGDNLVQGSMAFASVTRVTLPKCEAPEGEADRTLTIGLSDTIGLPVRLKRNTVLKVFNGSLNVGAVVGVDPEKVELNTIELETPLSGEEVAIYLIV